MIHLWPELRPHLFYARKSLKTWEGYQTIAENTPATKASLCHMFAKMAAAGFPEAAFVGHVALDCYPRSVDWDELQGEDVFLARSDRPGRQWEGTLKFGRRYRGERSKTGAPEQGVMIDQEWIIHVPAALLDT